MCPLISLAVIFLGALAPGAPTAKAAPFYEGPPVSRPDNPVDVLVFKRLGDLKIAPANLCSDGVFVRRVYLDVIGSVPTRSEARAFLQNPNPGKRRALIEELLRRDEYADYWSMKWSDILKVKAEFPVDLWPNAAQAYHHWIRSEIRDDVPMDSFVRDLLTASGSNFHVPQVNFYRAVQSRDPATLARAVALAFMGERAEKWPADRLAGLAAFFSQVGYKPTQEWKEEIVYWDQDRRGEGPAIFPDGSLPRLSPDRDPREVFADWLVTGENPRFTRAIANRIWFWILGRGIIHEPDDIRPDNPPANPELLAVLQHELAASHFSQKQLLRRILNSQTYQLAPVPKSDDPAGAANFASYPVRRLDAEVLIDALDAITGTTESYSSAIPEPFTFVPVEQRSIALPDGSITSSFLEMFGRASRDTGMESDRNNRSSPTQEMHLLNSTHIRQKIQQGPRIQALLRSSADPGAAVDGLYLAILSRFPVPEERRAALAYAKSSGLSQRDAELDVAWALINSAEFLYRH